MQHYQAPTTEQQMTSLPQWIPHTVCALLRNLLYPYEPFARIQEVFVLSWKKSEDTILSPGFQQLKKIKLAGTLLIKTYKIDRCLSLRFSKKILELVFSFLLHFLLKLFLLFFDFFFSFLFCFFFQAFSFSSGFVFRFLFHAISFC